MPDRVVRRSSLLEYLSSQETVLATSVYEHRYVDTIHIHVTFRMWTSSGISPSMSISSGKSYVLVTGGLAFGDVEVDGITAIEDGDENGRSDWPGLSELSVNRFESNLLMMLLTSSILKLVAVSPRFKLLIVVFATVIMASVCDLNLTCSILAGSETVTSDVVVALEGFPSTDSDSSCGAVSGSEDLSIARLAIRGLIGLKNSCFVFHGWHCSCSCLLCYEVHNHSLGSDYSCIWCKGNFHSSYHNTLGTLDLACDSNCRSNHCNSLIGDGPMCEDAGSTCQICSVFGS